MPCANACTPTPTQTLLCALLCATACTHATACFAQACTNPQATQLCKPLLACFVSTFTRPHRGAGTPGGRASGWVGVQVHQATKDPTGCGALVGVHLRSYVGGECTLRVHVQPGVCAHVVACMYTTSRPVASTSAVRTNGCTATADEVHTFGWLWLCVSPGPGLAQ